MGRGLIIASLFGVLILFFIVDKGVRKWLHIQKTETASRYVNRFHLMISVALLALFVFILTQNSNDRNLLTSDQFYPIASLLLASQVIDVYMHWKYHENPKEYIITLIYLGITVVLISVLFAVRSVTG